MSPAMGNAVSVISPLANATCPPFISITRLTAFTMYSSLEPIATILWQSWAIEAAMAPSLMPKPRMSPVTGRAFAS